MLASELIKALRSVRVVPVIDPKSKAECVSAVGALIAGGAKAIEITLRSDIAFATFQTVRMAYPNIVLGAGSVMDREAYEKAVALDADFTISPGRCQNLETYVQGKTVAHVPGVATPTEITLACQAGQKLLKFYPSEALGGAPVLKDFGRIFPEVMMMPSGGIKEANLPGYAVLPGVLSVGGSWMFADNGAYRAAGDMSAIMERSIAAMTNS